MLPVTIGSSTYLLAPYIGDIHDPGILGMDFCNLYGAALEGDTGRLTIKAPKKQTVQCRRKLMTGTMVNRYTVCIPGGETAALTLEGPEIDGQLLIEPRVDALQQLGLETTTTYHARKGTFGLPVYNQTSQTVILPEKAVTSIVWAVDR